LLEKATNGADADLPPGPTIDVGEPVIWTYEVTNPGPATVTGVAVTDDQGVVVDCPVTTLAAGESVICTGNGIAQPGQYANVATTTAGLPAGGTVSASDPSHYFGLLVRLQKLTNGQDADLPPGPVLAAGAAVSWTYEVTNLGGDILTDVAVTDDRGVTVTCPATDLGPGASMTCTGDGIAQAGQYANVGTVTALGPGAVEVADSDPSHYFGQDQVLDFGDAPDPAFPTSLASNGPRHPLGSSVYLGACVDSELDGQPAPGAAADDAAVGLATFGVCAVAGDDEDGVTFTSALVPGTTAAVEVVANAACTLSAWLDFDRDGDWLDAGEALFPGGVALAAGGNPLSFAVPAGAGLGATTARFRCTTDGEVPFVGQATDGEVEDHAVVLVAPADLTATKSASLLVDGDGDTVADASDTLLYTLVIANDGGAPATGVTLSDSPDANTALVVGSVTTTAGTVTSGNGAGETTVAVAVGTIAGDGGMATITYQVTIDDPLPNGVTSVANQGLISADGLADEPTDDPGQPGAADPTVVLLGGSSVPVPTLPGWGLLVLAAALAAMALRRVTGR
jgi:uncharacterized repeat protein (TIGR01451 family)